MDPAALVDEEEKALHAAYLQAAAAVGPGASVGDLLGALEPLAAPSEAFFDDVFVMAEDPALRANRLALCRAVAALPAGIVDFSELPGF